MKTDELVRQALIAAAYVVLGLALAPISFGALQFRIAEILMVLPFYNKKATYGLTIGCLLFNIISPFGIYDVIFGTFATYLACILISRLHSKHLIAVTAAIVNGFIVSMMITYTMGLTFSASIPVFLVNFSSICATEYIVVQLGVLLLDYLDKKEYLKLLKG